MVDIEKIDDELYKVRHGSYNDTEFKKLWKKIRNNKEIQRAAVKIKRNKWDSGDITEGLTICECMLRDYENVDPEAYNELIENIYNNPDIARLVVGGAINRDFSFLLLSLANPNLKLSEEQKAFAVEEAMNRAGTLKYKTEEQEYIKKASKCIKIDESMLNMVLGKFYSAKNHYHGMGSFDIRYYILSNPNWTVDEKEKLVNNFWVDNDDYEEALNDWEWDVINENSICTQDSFVALDISEFYYYTYDDILYYYEDKEKADKLWQEIEFCRLMKNLRFKEENELQLEYSKTEELNNMIEEGIALGVVDKGNISDGKNTFNNLYRQIVVLFRALCNSMPDIAWKSKNHYREGDYYSDTFTAGINTEEGQIVYNLGMKYWDSFEVPELEKLPEYDLCSKEECLRRISNIRSRKRTNN